MKIELDNIYNCDCLAGMRDIPDCSVDLVVTSPPYDNLRTYGGVGEGWNFETFKGIAKQLARILKDGGVIVWNVNDATINGSETGTSFRQALFFKDECGLNLHDTMIWCKNGGGAVGSNLCYTQNFEYMFVFSKGKPQHVNLIKDVPNEYFGTNKIINHGRRKANGEIKLEHRKMPSEFGRRNNWWLLNYQQSNEDKGFSDSHPAVFPLKLARGHVISWSNENDLILDPFMGSGTTAIACIKEKRHFIGFELNEEYYKKACDRINRERAQMTLDF